MRAWFNVFFVIAAAMGGYFAAIKNLSENSAPADLGAIIATSKLVDLTHTMEEGMPPGPSGDTPPTITPMRPRPDGTSGIHRYDFPGQWGTHVDPPVHFVGGLRDLEDIPLSEMILPMIVIDVHEKVAENPDYTVTLQDVFAWEEMHGPVPANSFVALRTDWSKRWPSLERMRNRDANGTSHSPGWSKDVIDYLVGNQKVTAIGHETLDTDPGVVAGSGSWPLQTYYMGLNKYQIENMTNLDKIPPIGAYIVATWAKPKDGSGFPARVFAIIPNKQ